MRPQLHRLPETVSKAFCGSAIDRGAPIQFRLDGRIVSGFAGDTVLSAALASGIDTLGLYQHSPIGLNPRAAPAISYASLANDPQRALPMARTLIRQGAEFVTIGGTRGNLVTRLLQPGRSLGLSLDNAHALDRPWRSVLGSPTEAPDLLVIGGGVSGLAAALAGARAGLSVLLVEASPHLGGHSGLFGTQDGEDSPDQSMTRLAAEVRANPAITTLTATRVFALRPGLARAHQVTEQSGAMQGHVIDIAAPRIVLATGSLERLPVFPGNRLPGVMGTLDAFELASRYGIWPGKRAIIATASSPAYRLAMLADDAGITVDRIFDSRPRPASRFIEFSRAYGIVQSPGDSLGAVGIARAGGSLSVHRASADAVALVTDRLLVCGGWQPDLTLWHVAGGASQWHHGHRRLEAFGTCEGIALAGSAAGYRTRRGCIQSGADSIDQLLGRQRSVVDDPVIAPLYETPDGALPISEPRPSTCPEFLDSGAGLLRRPAPQRRRFKLPFANKPAADLLVLSEAPQPLTICDVAAGVDLGLVPSTAAGVVAQERVALVPLAQPEISEASQNEAPVSPTTVPAYLKGRYGRDARVVRLVPREPRSFEPGALAFLDPDETAPPKSVGVVLGELDGTSLALMADPVGRQAHIVTIRDKGAAQATIQLDPG